MGAPHQREFLGGVIDDPKLAAFQRVTASSVALAEGAFADVLEVTATTKAADVFALEFDFVGGAPTAPVARLQARAVGGAYATVFPAAASYAVTAGQVENLEHLLRVPAGHDYKVQLKATAVAGKKVDLKGLYRVQRG